MTNSPISDIGMMNPYMNEMGGGPKVEVTDFKGSFKDAIETQMGNMKNGYSELISTTSVESAKKSEAVSQTKKEEPVKKDTATDKRSKSEKAETKGTKTKETAKDDKVTKETAEKVSDKENEVVKKISETLGVTEEDVLSAMEILGLTMADLLDETNMADIVTQLSGSQDVLTIVTDENLYGKLETLQDFVTNAKEDLMEELDLSQEALDEVLVQTEELEQHPIAENEMVKQTEDKPLTGMKDFKTTISENGDQMTVSVKVDEATGAQIATYEKNGNSQFENEDSSNNNKSMHDDEKNDTHAEIPLFTENTQLNNIEVSGVDTTEQVPTFAPSTQEIADQIMESMKVNMRAETTELEMNLHPASLGTVRINLTSNGGQVTAQFMAQNETVKAAIESQVVQLTNQLEEQGIKIEAVEVTLASHQFDSNSGQTGTNNGQSESESNKPKVGKIRRLNLNELEEDGELENLDEADKIAADMMAKNGNTVDYTA